MRLFWCVVLLLAWAAVSFGQAINSPLPSTSLSITADFGETSFDGTLEHVWGHAVLRSGLLILNADDITANHRTGDVLASGHLALTHGLRRMTGEHLTYNLNTQRGTMLQAFVWERGVIIRGERMDFTPHQIVAQHASFTTCPYPAPHFAIQAERITFTESSTPRAGELPTGGHVELHHGSVWFHGKRRFTLPDYTFAVGDLQQQRAALFPTAGSGSGDGPYVSWLHHFGTLGARDSAELNLRFTQRRGIRGFFEADRTIPSGDLYFDYMRRQSLGDLEPATNQIIGSTAAVLVNREPEFGARLRSRPLNNEYTLTGDFAVGQYSEMNSEATKVLASARIGPPCSAVINSKPHVVQPHLALDYAVGGHEAVYSTNQSITVSFLRGTADYAWNRQDHFALSYIDRGSWGNTPFLWDRVDMPQELRGDLYWKVNPAWRLRVVERYDLEDDRTHDLLISATRTAHCLDYTIGWRKQNGDFFIAVNLVPAPSPW